MAERRALIAGASGPTSVGVAIAHALSERGDRVFLTSGSHREAVVRPLAEELGWTWLALDPDEPASLRAAVEIAEPEVLIHTLVGAPSEALKRPLTELGRADFESTLSRGAWTLAALCGFALPSLAAGAGRVVALSSALAERAAPNYHVVGITKAALEATVRYLAWELGPSGVYCNAVRFPLIPTDAASGVLGRELCEAVSQRAARSAPTRQAASAEQVARVVAWLSSPAPHNLTGQIVSVDGGLSLAT